MSGPPPPPRYWNYENIRARADSFLQKYWPEHTTPVPIEDIVDVQMGLGIVPVEHLRTQHDVEGFLSVDRQNIYVDLSLYTNPKFSRRYRFTLAHETGHWELHEPLYAQVSFESFEDWKKYLSGLDDKDQFFYENQAYCFAGLVLVPQDRLAAVVGAAVEEAQSNNPGFKFDAGKLPHCEYLSERVAKTFEVSGQVVLKRGYYDRLWTHR